MLTHLLEDVSTIVLQYQLHMLLQQVATVYVSITVSMALIPLKYQYLVLLHVLNLLQYTTLIHQLMLVLNNVYTLILLIHLQVHVLLIAKLVFMVMLLLKLVRFVKCNVSHVLDSQFVLHVLLDSSCIRSVVSSHVLHIQLSILHINNLAYAS